MTRLAITAVSAILSACTSTPPKPEPIPAEQIPKGYKAQECQIVKAAHTDTVPGLGGAPVSTGGRSSTVECHHSQHVETTISVPVCHTQGGKELPLSDCCLNSRGYRLGVVVATGDAAKAALLKLRASAPYFVLWLRTRATARSATRRSHVPSAIGRVKGDRPNPVRCSRVVWSPSTTVHSAICIWPLLRGHGSASRRNRRVHRCAAYSAGVMERSVLSQSADSARTVSSSLVRPASASEISHTVASRSEH
jgi:hypothetical protein